MTPFSFDIVGFDLDGTLVDTAGDLAAALNVALAEAGRAALPLDRVRAMIGGGGRHLLEAGLAATGGSAGLDVARLYTTLIDYYAAHIAVHSRPFPGAIEAVDALCAKGVRVGIATNKVHARAVALLDALGVADRFACVIGGDTLGEGSAKPSPLMIRTLIERLGGGRCAFVGDTVYDTAAARAAGVPSVAMRFGAFAPPAAELGADAVIETFDALIPTLERLR